MLTDGCLGLRDLCELNNASTLGTRALIENLSKLDSTGGLKQLDKIVVSG